MALTLDALKIMAPYLRNAKILSLGYPDILATAQDIKRVFGFTPEKFTKRGKWHGDTEKLPDTEELIAKLGSTLECVDIFKDFGIEKIADMNEPVELGQYDLVIDPGTTEHVMNIGQALLNVANAVKVGGRAFHCPPVTMVNHGLWSFNPTGLHDWYSQNDWEIEALYGWTREQMFTVHPTDRFTVPPDFSLYCLAKRRTNAPMHWVTQTKYLKKAEKNAA